MIDSSLPTESKKFDLFKTSVSLAFYLAMAFWIIVYYFDLLEKLFPSLKGKALINLTFFIPLYITFYAACVSYICDSIIYNEFEKGHYQMVGLQKKPTINVLLFKYSSSRSYGKLLVVFIKWLSVLIMAAVSSTVFFGMVIYIQSLHN